MSAISVRFKENPRETRTTPGELVGGAIRLMPKKDAPNVAVRCALSSTTFQLAPLSSALVVVGRQKKIGTLVIS